MSCGIYGYVRQGRGKQTGSVATATSEGKGKRLLGHHAAKAFSAAGTAFDEDC